MNKTLKLLLPLTTLLAVFSFNTAAATVVEKFEIEGLISPASPKALSSALESGLKVKIKGLNLKTTVTGWPVLSVEFDNASVKRSQIEKLIDATKDPAGHLYKVHQGPANANAPLTDEEIKAIALLGPASEAPPKASSPAATAKSIASGKERFNKNCAKCHGIDGNGQGPAAPGMTTSPRPLWVWQKQDAATQGYLFSIISDGRTDMPPWGMHFSESERWELVNYIQTLKAP